MVLVIAGRAGRGVTSCTIELNLDTKQFAGVPDHTLSELTNILYLSALVILTLFSLVDTITEGS